MIEYLLDLWRGNTLGARRSSQWWRTKREYAKLYPKICPFCKTKKRIELHHKKKFSDFPELENVFDNLQWLCRQHHLDWGHLRSYFSYNPKLDEDIKAWKIKIKNRP